MDATQQKGNVVGAITLHFNDKLRVSHVEITGRGDLVSKRTIQDSIMLVFRAIGQHRARRKVGGKVAAAEVKKAEARDTSRLQKLRETMAEKRKKQEEQLLQRALANKTMREEAEEKAKVKLTKFPKSTAPVPEEAKKKAREEALKLAETVAAKNKIEPVRAASKTKTK